MQAVREFTQLEDNLLTLRLPQSFNAKRVEVIVMPAQEPASIGEEQPQEVRRTPSPKLKGTQINGDIMSPIVPAEDWNALK
jgi:hypothetical protein